MLKPLLVRLRSLSAGVKLSGTLALMVLITAGVLSLVHDHLANTYLQTMAERDLADHLIQAEAMLAAKGQPRCPAPGAEPWLAQADRLSPRWAAVRLFCLDSEGRPMGDAGQAPPPQAVRRAAQRLFDRQGVQPEAAAVQDYTVAVLPLGSGEAMAAWVHVDEFAGKALPILRSFMLLAAFGICLGVALFGVWLAQRELVAPLTRLTRAAEHVAKGDLTPPEPLDGRFDELGRLSRALASMTEAARAMVQQARTSQLRFQQLFTENRDVSFIIDGEGRLEDINPAGVELFGYDNLGQMLKMTSTTDLFANDQERELYLNTLAAQGYVQDFPATMQRRDGSVFDALITAALRVDTDGRFGLVRDVTQMRQAQRALKENEARFRRLVESAPDIIYRWSLTKSVFEYISPAVETITGYKAQEVMDNPRLLFERLHPDWAGEVRKVWDVQVSGQGPQTYEHLFQMRHRDGTDRWLREHSVMVRDETGRPEAIEGIATDVTDRMRVDEARQRGQRLVESILQSLPVAVMVVDSDHRVVHWNTAMERLSGRKAEEMVDTDQQWEPFYQNRRSLLADLVVDGDTEALRRLYGDMDLKPSVLVEGGWECEGYLRDVGGENRYLYFLAAPITDDEGRAALAVETLVDLSDKRELEEELRRLSVTDELTGLYNQRFFYATTSREIEVALRYGQPLALLMLDLDHFKRFNDQWGHLEGDKALAATAKAIQAAVRASDVACRYGGEEFAVLLPRTSLDEARAVAERVRVEVAGLSLRPAQAEGRAVTITVSVGVAVFGQGMSLNDLVREADRALYTAKEAGRNRVAVRQAEGGIEVTGPARGGGPPG